MEGEKNPMKGLRRKFAALGIIAMVVLPLLITVYLLFLSPSDLSAAQTGSQRIFGATYMTMNNPYFQVLGISSRTRHADLAWEFCKLLSIDEGIQRKLYTHSHGISPLPAVAEDPELLRQIHDEIPGGSGFSPEMIHQLMSDAVVSPKFNAYSQAMIMVESAIQESAGSQLGQSAMLIAESEINIFLNKS